MRNILLYRFEYFQNAILCISFFLFLFWLQFLHRHLGWSKTKTHFFIVYNRYIFVFGLRKFVKWDFQIFKWEIWIFVFPLDPPFSACSQLRIHLHWKFTSFTLGVRTKRISMLKNWICFILLLCVCLISLKYIKKTIIIQIAPFFTLSVSCN